ncbi:hypothetical protein [Brumimicrobium mesophilum]|uniref:hypothetical protein n=1 Tax=Brumimicrobium mesophilum TaxID=392717 RepID=UPI00131DAD7E|nr:hypothetical protein [Brumimicrobium mesophilum]
MKRFLLVSILFVLIGCSSESEKLTSGMQPFMAKNFSKAKFEIRVNNKIYKLMIFDKGNVMNKDNYVPIVTRTFSEFYNVFSQSNNSAFTDSQFEILYENDSLKWKSDRLSLIELSEVYETNNQK